MENILSDEKRFALDLIDFINASPSTFQVVRNTKAALLRKGYTELNHKESWSIEPEGKYFVSQNDSALIAFIVGKGDIAQHGIKMIAAHTDSPGIKIKPAPEIIVKDSYIKLNVEVYGGPILNTWFDRPLSIAGRVCISSENPFIPETKYINFKKPVGIIPNLAIHFSREINEGSKIHKQKDILPLIAQLKTNLEKDNYFLKFIAQEINVPPQNILDFDLTFYEYEKGCLFGFNEEFISCAKLDNLAMIHAGFEALFNASVGDSTNMMICFDNEEVGSNTKQGAGSPLLKNTIERIVYQLNKDNESYYRALYNSFMISADMAHALHPNFSEIHDATNQPIINKGPVIKINANQKYTTDGSSSAVFEMICRRAGVPVQKFVNRSDLAGGSTLGAVSTSQLEIRSVDVGNPMLGMHSIRETSGVYDQYYMKKAFEEFFSL